MSRLTDLLVRLAESDPDVANDIRRETDALTRRKPFGLNFERHIPETVQLPRRRVRRGDRVAFRCRPEDSLADLESRTWIVTGFQGTGDDRCANLIQADPSQTSPDTTSRSVTDLVVVAEFRDPIYPGLRPTGVVDSGSPRPYHVVINGENYHVLEALTFACPGMVDCIYLDPPYNSRDKQWKYNNDYVDSDDDYRHSKWLAMMERRLKVAKELLNPADAALIVTIDEREVLRLGLLLEQIFPEARIQMVTSVISAKGAVRRGQFSRVEEHLFFVLFGAARIRQWVHNMLPGASATDDGSVEASGEAGSPDESAREPVSEPIEWLGLRRREPSSVRGARPNQFFPIFVDPETGHIHSIGDAVADDVDRSSVAVPDGTVAVWPLRRDGTEMLWGLTPERVRANWADGFVRIKWRPVTRTGTVYYLPSGTIASLRNGEATITARQADGSIEGVYAPDSGTTTPPKRVWHMRSHNAETGGTTMLSKLVPGRRFEYPKSLYAVEDSLRFVVGHNPDALILDFFAGSGTTAHAVMRLNRQDGGRRRSIMVTNNEVSAAEADDLADRGFRPGDSEWEALGICEFLTKPRVRAAIEGRSPDGREVKGAYRFTDAFPISDGFAENAAFFDLTYEDPERVRYGVGFEAVASLLWLRAGATGPPITRSSATFQITDTYALLFDVDACAPFISAVRAAGNLRLAYVVTEDESQFQVVAAQLPGHVEPVRLYAAYLDHFRIASRV